MFRLKYLSIIVLVFALVLSGFGGYEVSAMGTIVVSSTADIPNSDYCTLRDAILAADTDTARGGCPAGSGLDAIVLASGATYSLTRGTLPAIHSQITIEGNESVVERSSAGGTSDFRIFYLSSNGDLTLNNLTVRNGKTSPGEGGGIKNYMGTLRIIHSTVSGNTGSGIVNLYGASLTIKHSNIINNSGGGIINNRSSVMIDNSTVSGNFENTNGGGVHNYLGSVDINKSTVSGNSANSNGGGIYNRGVLTLTNSTISGNTATGNGGGIWNYGGNAILTHSTISDNAASGASGIYNAGVLELENTIIGFQRSGQNCAGIPISLGYNLDSDGTCNLTGIGDIYEVDPLLGPLDDNGGPTETHAILTNSPAFDVIPVTNCAVTTDQRGVSRSQGPACDTGAFEVEYQVVNVDIKPGSDSNLINCDNQEGIITVAVLTTEEFDALTVDYTTVTFEGASETHVDKKTGYMRLHAEDVDLDGDVDLVFHFSMDETGLSCVSTEGTLLGETYDGVPIIGNDSVRMIYHDRKGEE